MVTLHPTPLAQQTDSWLIIDWPVLIDYFIFSQMTYILLKNVRFPHNFHKDSKFGFNISIWSS